MYLSPSEYANLTGDAAYFLNQTLENVSNALDEELGTTFSIHNLTSEPIFGVGKMVKIGAWQAINSVTKNGTVLNYGSDYTYQRFQDFNQNKTFNPITGLVLNTSLTSTDSLIITGDFGFSNGLPPDLANLLRQIVTDCTNYQTQMSETNGAGLIASERSVSLQRTYTMPQDYLNNLQNTVNNYFSSPSSLKVLGKYKNALRRSVAIAV